MAKMIELPPQGHSANDGKIFVNPSRIQAVEVFKDHVVIKMNIPNMAYDFYDDKMPVALAALVDAQILPGTAPVAGQPITVTVQTTVPHKEKK
jgi:hypothetical protein